MENYPFFFVAFFVFTLKTTQAAILSAAILLFSNSSSFHKPDDEIVMPLDHSRVNYHQECYILLSMTHGLDGSRILENFSYIVVFTKYTSDLFHGSI